MCEYTLLFIEIIKCHTGKLVSSKLIGRKIFKLKKKQFFYLEISIKIFLKRQKFENKIEFYSFFKKRIKETLN